MSISVRPLTPADAPAAALLHAEGQAGTFLTGLGETFLRALYREMAALPYCYGYVAVEGAVVIGMVAGTTASNRVFRDLIWRRGWRLALPVAGALLRHPTLLPKVFETFLYPSQQPQEAGEAELFYIGVRATRRSEGVGQALFHALAAESARRGMRALGLTVDDANETAKRFYQRQGMTPTRRFILYHRPMCWYRLVLRREEALPQ